MQLNERVAATLEIESGMNDPMAVYLTLTFIAMALALDGSGAEPLTAADVFLSLLRQMGWGCLLGLGSGWAMAELLKRLGRGEDGGGGIRA